MGITCSSGQVLIKAGKGASTEWYSGAYIRSLDPYPIETLISGAQAIVNAAGRKDYTAIYSTLSANVKDFITELVSNIAAIEVIKYDMDSYNSRIEAEDNINILRDSKLLGIGMLRNKEVQRFINGT